MDKNGQISNFTQNDFDRLIRDVIEPMASDGLRTICLSYKNYVTSNQKQENEVTKI